MMPKTRYIAVYMHIYILIFSIVDLFSISIGNIKNHVATLICLRVTQCENMFNMSIIDYPNR